MEVVVLEALFTPCERSLAVVRFVLATRPALACFLGHGALPFDV
jgi:hypothetical protein